MTYAEDQMRMAAGSARYWLGQVELGFRPHLDGADNTVAFVAHYRRQLLDAEAYLRGPAAR